MPLRQCDRFVRMARNSERCRVLALLAVGLLSMHPAQADDAQTTQALPAPDFALGSSTGHNLRLSEYRGKVVVLNFWSLSCGPCFEQLAWLDALEPDNGLDLLSVNVDASRHRPHVLEDHAYGFPVLFDHDKTVIRLYDPRRLPMLVLVDPHGTIRFIHEGHRAGDEALIERELAALLTE